MMHEHFFHLLITLLPFLAASLIWCLKASSDKYPVRLALFLIGFLIILLQAVPVHYVHATVSQDFSTHQCCLPVPTTITSNFQIRLPELIVDSLYIYPAADYQPPVLAFYNNRSPPVI